MINFQQGKTVNFNYVTKQWREREKGVWDDYITKVGHLDWHDYRFGKRDELPGTLNKYGFDQFNLETINWLEIETSPDKENIRQIYLGPFLGWANEWNNGNREAFPTSKISEQTEKAKQNPKIAENLKELEQDSIKEITLIGLALEQENKVVLIDGHHTLSALELANHLEIKHQTKLILHVGILPSSNTNLFHQLQNGEIPLKLPKND